MPLRVTAPNLISPLTIMAKDVYAMHLHLPWGW